MLSIESTIPLLSPGSTAHTGGLRVDLQAEWLESDGLGGFASGTVCGIRTRRYHAALLQACRPPTGRLVLVNGFDAVLHTASGEFPLSSQAYAPGVFSPGGLELLEGFGFEPWPTWQYRLDDDTGVRVELFAVKGRSLTIVRFSRSGPREQGVLEVRPFLSGRDYHALHHENPDFRFDAAASGEWLSFRPYPGIPEIRLLSNGTYREEPHWYRNFLYERERERGLDYVEELAAPGLFRFDLGAEPALLVLASSLSRLEDLDKTAAGVVGRLEEEEHRRRSGFLSELHRAADDYLVRRGRGTTIIAGYPWFTDWGRDTFVSLRGLCLAGGRPEVARSILLEWAGELDEGMLPNFFPDSDHPPEYNTVDAALWFVVAAYELIERSKQANGPLTAQEIERLWEAIEGVLAGYSEGARYRIALDPADGLLRAGVPGLQLTWMDARVDGRVITPRIGKPVEIEALWLNALAIGALRSKRWKRPLSLGRASFGERFWNERRGCLYDVIDVDHRLGAVDESVRPNQLFAVGGLPFPMLAGERARSVVDCAERELLTPEGLRTLAPGEPAFAAHYLGGPAERDGAYHQGTAWPWLLGPFVEAWVRTRGGSAAVKAEAYRRFVEPLEETMHERGGLGHLPEIADAEEPYTLRGCPFQAWSLGELMRLKLDVLDTHEEDELND